MKMGVVLGFSRKTGPTGCVQRMFITKNLLVQFTEAEKFFHLPAGDSGKLVV